MKSRAIVFVVDDDNGTLRAVGDLLQSEKIPVQLFSSARRFLRQYDPMCPGCIICDLEMPGFDGLALQRALKRMGSRTPIIFLSGRATIPRSVQAMKDGATDFLTKPQDMTKLVRTVRSALARDADQRVVGARFGELTDREREVLERVTAGCLNKQIASELKVTERTVKFHRGNLARKLGTTTAAQLIHLALSSGLPASHRSRSKDHG